MRPEYSEAELRTLSVRAAVAVLAGLLGAAALGPVAATPVQAHSGGNAVVLVADLTLTPVGDTWNATTTLVDSDSGSPLRQVDVKAFVGTPVRTVTLAQGGSLGTYQGALGKIPAGPAHVELQVRTLPGSEPVNPYSGSWDVTLVAGQPVQVASEAAGGAGSNVALIVSVAAAVILIALLYGLFSLRRRSAVPAPPK